MPSSPVSSQKSKTHSKPTVAAIEQVGLSVWDPILSCFRSQASSELPTSCQILCNAVLRMWPGPRVRFSGGSGAAAGGWRYCTEEDKKLAGFRRSVPCLKWIYLWTCILICQCFTVPTLQYLASIVGTINKGCLNQASTVFTSDMARHWSYTRMLLSALHAVTCRASCWKALL